MTSKQLTEGNQDYRPLLKEIKKSEETHIVLDCDFERIQDILHQADEIELLTDYHNYLVTTLDMDKINLEQYKDMVRMMMMMMMMQREGVGGVHFQAAAKSSVENTLIAAEIGQDCPISNLVHLQCTKVGNIEHLLTWFLLWVQL